jgi:hypothetical protein
MPSRNIVKVDVENSYYHIYARGHAGQPIFNDDEDYQTFLDLFSRHLSEYESYDKYGKPYAHLRGEVELLDYQLMDSYFHLLIYQIEEGSMTRLMRSLMTSYSCYYNKRYSVSGSLFESRYKASRLSSDELVKKISRYIHISHSDWRSYPNSSISALFGIGKYDWLQSERLVNLFGSVAIYADYLDDIKDYETSLDDMSDELANKIL